MLNDISGSLYKEYNYAKKQKTDYRQTPQCPKNCQSSIRPSPTASQIRYKVDSAKYLKYAKQTHFAVNGW
jgi:hypothetical protein